jgi:hypothetical protein
LLPNRPQTAPHSATLAKWTSNSSQEPSYWPWPAASFAVTALAQWQWIDKDGRKVYSDRSPPSDIPEKNILKMPRGAKGKSVAGDAC